MAMCIVVNPDGSLSQANIQGSESGISDASCPYVLVTKQEAESFVTGTEVVQELQQLASTYFDFNPETFSYLQAWTLASFIAAFGAARLVTWMKN